MGIMPKMRALYSILNIGIKSRGIKWISVFLIGLILIGSLNCCFLYSYYDSAETIIDRMIPFADGTSHWGKWNNVTLLENDAYGRQLFLSITIEPQNEALSDFSGDTIYTYIIVQLETDSTLFCYPELCYQYAPSDSSIETINQIKVDNDWGKPLVLKKMIALPIGTGTQNLFAVDCYEQDEIRNALKEKVEFSDAYIDVVYSKDKEPFFVLREVLQQEQLPYTFGRAWIVSVDKSYCLTAYAELKPHPCDWSSDINKFINANPATSYPLQG